MRERSREPCVQLPADCPVWAQLRFGDYRRLDFKDIESPTLQGWMMDAVTERAHRPVDWFSTTI